MTQIIGIGVSSLLAYEAALDVTSQNIANSDNASYSRRLIDFSESPFYSGVKVSDVRRIVDETAEDNLQVCETTFGRTDVYQQQLQQFEPVFDTSTTSVGKYMSDSLTALRKLELDGRSSVDRSMYMDKLSFLASRFKSVGDEVTQQLESVNTALVTTTQAANGILSQIGDINKEIFAAGQAGNVNALLDQRQGLVHSLAQYFDFTTQVDSTGIMNISMRNGLRIVNGNDAGQLTTTVDPANSGNLIVGLKNGTAVIPLKNIITDGQLSGWMNYRENMLEPTQRSLNQLALVFSDTLNAQNKLGVDTSGTLGANIFTDINSPALTSGRALANLTNTGLANMTVNIDNVSALTSSDYKLVIGASNTYTLTRASDNKVYSGTLTGSFPDSVSADGFTVDISSGSYGAGDQYLISPTHNASSKMALSMTQASQLALGWPVLASKSQQNGGSGVISVTTVTDTTTSAFSTAGQLSPPVKVNFITPTSYELLDATTNLPVIPGGPYTYDPTISNSLFPSGYNPGYQISLSGAINAGDSFNLTYNSDPASDARNAVAMAGVYDKQTLLANTGLPVKFDQGYDSIVGTIAAETNAAVRTHESSDVLVQQAMETRAGISGVDLQGETLNLARYQQMYQASSQIIQTAKTVLESILALIGR
jgi:flagellar hook-associated protein 1 FlgK